MDNMDIPSYLPDGPLVGTTGILSSERVYAAPLRINQPVPVPSVYRDGRGEIHNFMIGATKDQQGVGSFRGTRLNLLYTKAGVKRSGDIHPNTQHDFVFAGRVQVWTLEKDGRSASKTYGPNEYINIPPYTPHIFEFKEDSVLAEWWDGTFKAWFYEPYRKVVERSFKSKVPGRLLRYMVEDDAKDSFLTSRGRSRESKRLLMAVALGMSIGLAVGLGLQSL